MEVIVRADAVLGLEVRQPIGARGQVRLLKAEENEVAFTHIAAVRSSSSPAAVE
jgi:hypothetical protein